MSMTTTTISNSVTFKNRAGGEISGIVTYKKYVAPVSALVNRYLNGSLTKKQFLTASIDGPKFKRTIRKTRAKKQTIHKMGTTLEDWRKTPVCKCDFNPNIHHPVCREIVSFFRKVDRIGKNGGADALKIFQLSLT